MRAPRGSITVVLALGILVGCQQEIRGLYLSVTTEPGVDTATSLVIRALVDTDGSELRFEQAYSLAGRDLSAAAYAIKVESEGFTERTEALLSLVAMDGSRAVASYTGRHVVSTTDVVDVVMKAVSSGCDADGDGYQACNEKPGCCSADDKADAADCDDGDPEANPFAETKACRICSVECGRGDSDGASDVVEPLPDVLHDGVDGHTGDLLADVADGDTRSEALDALDALDSNDAEAFDAKTEADSCVDDCPAKGRTECVDQDTMRECDDFDEDGCLEWGDPVACGGLSGCVEGACDCLPNCQAKACGTDGCGGSCGTCGNGKACTSGVCTCSGSTDADCDGKDNDCDGQKDEHYVGVTSCFKPGACSAANKASTCTGGVETPCRTGTSTTETCNGVDDDCDGTTDNGGDALCLPGQACQGVVGCVCAPNCTGKQCGVDGCGGTCGACGGDEACEEAVCVCVDGCTQSGKKECTDGTHWHACGNSDGDSCLEWGPSTACGNDKACTGEGQCCACTTGVCCDGCNYKSSSAICQEDVTTAYSCQEGTACAQDVYVRHQDRYCSGTSATCDGSVSWDAPTVADDCTSTETCTPGSATCTFNNACETWTDSTSGKILVWQRNGGAVGYWDEAKAYCDSNQSGLPGAGWRLPTISELRSLIRGCASTILGGGCEVTDSCLSCQCPSSQCDGCSLNGGPAGGCYWEANLNGDCKKFWSSSPYEGCASNTKWIVDFTNGHLDGGGSVILRIRCVRSGP